MDVRTRLRTSPGIANPDARRRATARRRAAGARRDAAAERGPDEYRPLRELGRALPASVPAELAALPQPRRRLRRPGSDGERRADPARGRTSTRSRDQPPLYGRWHALTERLLTERDGTRAHDRRTGCTSSTSTRGSARRRASAPGDPGQPGGTWTPPGTQIGARARGKPADPAGAARPAGLADRGTAHARAARGESPPSGADAAPRRSTAGSWATASRLAPRRHQPGRSALVSTTARRTLRPARRLAAGLASAGRDPWPRSSTRVNRRRGRAAPPRSRSPERGDAGRRSPTSMRRRACRSVAWRWSAPALRLALARSLLVVLLACSCWSCCSCFAAVAVVPPSSWSWRWLLLVARLRGRLRAGSTPPSLGEDGQTPGDGRRPARHARLQPGHPSSLLGPRPVEPAARPEPTAPGRFASRRRCATPTAWSRSSERGGTTSGARRRSTSRRRHRRRRRASDPLLTIPAADFSGITLPPGSSTAIGERVRRADGLPGDRHADVRAAHGPVRRLFLPNIEPHRAEQRSRCWRPTSGSSSRTWSASTTSSPASCCGASTRPTSAAATSASSGTCSAPRPPSADAEALREKLRDIPPLAPLVARPRLGDHDHREQPGERGGRAGARDPRRAAQEVPDRGRSTPTGRCWQPTRRRRSTRRPSATTRVERRLRRRGVDRRIQGATPLYEAKVDARHLLLRLRPHRRGGQGRHRRPGDDDPGWFFVIKERPGEPRFGLDTTAAGDLNVWNDLAWPDVMPGAPRACCIDGGRDADASPSSSRRRPRRGEARAVQRRPHVALDADDERRRAGLHPLQAPVLVAVHAAEMLPGADRA